MVVVCGQHGVAASLRLADRGRLLAHARKQYREDRVCRWSTPSDAILSASRLSMRAIARPLRAAALFVDPPDACYPASSAGSGLPVCQRLAPRIIKLYLAGIVIAALAGLYLQRSVDFRAKADRRQQEIINGFPDALDLMLVCVEAGLGMDAAFARVGMEMTTSHPKLAEQFGSVVLELRAGRSHEDALRRMADRAGAPRRFALSRRF